MVVGKLPVDFGIDAIMQPWQPRGEHFQRGAGSAVAGIPADPHPGQAADIDAGQSFEEAIDIGMQHLAGFRGSLAIEPVAGGCHLPQFEDVRAKKWQTLKYHLEAVIIGGVMASGYLNAAIDILG